MGRDDLDHATHTQAHSETFSAAAASKAAGHKSVRRELFDISKQLIAPGNDVMDEGDR
jgi:hypothetical protein